MKKSADDKKAWKITQHAKNNMKAYPSSLDSERDTQSLQLHVLKLSIYFKNVSIITLSMVSPFIIRLKTLTIIGIKNQILWISFH